MAEMSILKTSPILLLAVALSFSQCKVNKNASSANTAENRILQEITITDSRRNTETYPYRESHKQTFDLIHTTLWLSFDYEKQHVLGEAKLTLHPYFYPQQILQLDAKQFIIHKIALLKQDTQILNYTYNNRIIEIDLGKTYTRNDTFSVYIEYTARPNEIKEEGSAAISNAKGLYFINPLKADTNKPRQIWSQGETQSNSGWFPTIDYPNEKMTQDIYLTVEQQETTLSNGTLVYSNDNPNGTRTDYWSQRLPHAPYLTMIAVGEFVETRDFWRDSVEVNSYLEKAYAPYAKMIFGTTPEMMECFSKRLGVDYPWDKYSQIVVRDFVSGAMENTSAVVHFEPVQHDSREHLDNTWEHIISHELFHHWFGDLVTCESWSNISLNESFASYGEYLWNEYKYGKTLADYDFEDNLKAYLNQKRAYNKKLIRYHYRSREDMFDVVSYQKGSRILHMLRDYIGDDAFFTSLKLYLTKNKFKTAEVHDLRLAFEEVTGEDLNWFFNQWYFGSGHPELSVSTRLSDDKKQVSLTINQTQDTTQSGIFNLPVAVDVYNAQGKATRHNIRIDKTNWQTGIKSDEPIALVVFDAKNILLAKVSEQKSKEEYALQFLYAPTYRDKSLAVDGLAIGGIDTLSSVLTSGIEQALNDSFFGYRELAIELIGALSPSLHKQYEDRLVNLAATDPKSSVRVNAMMVLSEWDGKRFIPAFTKGLNDSSYNVVAASLSAISDIDGTKALEAVQPLLYTTNRRLQMTVNEVIADHAQSDYVAYFEKQLSAQNHYTYQIFSYYNQYLLKQESTIVRKALPQLGNWTKQDNKEKAVYSVAAKQCLSSLKKKYQTQIEDADKQLSNKKLKADEKQGIISRKESAQAMVSEIANLLGN